MTGKKEAFLRAITERQDELFATLSALVRIDSQNFGSSGREEAAAAYIAERLRGIGLTPDVYSPMDVPGLPENPDYWDGHHVETRPNVTACRKGSARRRLMLAAHSDTVPVGDPANWTFPPFSGELRDGRILGRGACDDKYGIAAVLYLLTLLRDAELELPYDLLFCAYSDEENGGGNGTLAACLKYPCEDIVNLDCKNFDIWAVAAGGGRLRAYIRADRPLDSCGPMLDGLAALRDAFAEFGRRRAAELREVPLYRDTNIPDTAVRFTEMRTGDGSSDFDRAFVEVCYYTTRTSEEIDAELRAMGEALERRLLPMGMHFDRFERTTRHFHFTQTAAENPAMASLMRAAKTASGRTLAPCGSCLSDLSLFIKYGSPRAFSFGVGRDFGVYGGAHQADEFIECERLLEFTRILGEFLLDYGA